jgi:hypothetical protein
MRWLFPPEIGMGYLRELQNLRISDRLIASFYSWRLILLTTSETNPSEFAA